MNVRLTIQMALTIALAILSLAMSTYAAYSHNDKAIEHRLTVVETQQQVDAGRLERMENKIDRLVEWALGKKP